MLAELLTRIAILVDVHLKVLAIADIDEQK